MEFWWLFPLFRTWNLGKKTNPPKSISSLPSLPTIQKILESRIHNLELLRVQDPVFPMIFFSHVLCICIFPILPFSILPYSSLSVFCLNLFILITSLWLRSDLDKICFSYPRCWGSGGAKVFARFGAQTRRFWIGRDNGCLGSWNAEQRCVSGFCLGRWPHIMGFATCHETTSFNHEFWVVYSPFMAWLQTTGNPWDMFSLRVSEKIGWPANWKFSSCPPEEQKDLADNTIRPPFRGRSNEVGLNSNACTTL